MMQTTDREITRGANLVASWFDFRRRRLDATSSQNALEAPVRRFLEDMPGLRYVGSDGNGAELADPQRTRYLDFEHIADNLILSAARAGLLSANLAAIDGAVKSSDLGVASLAYELAQHLQDGARSQQPQLLAVEAK